MLIKERDTAIELQVLHALSGRMGFSPKMKRQLWNSRTGQDGEAAFDALGIGVDECTVRLNDLTLVVDGKICQLDAVYICDGVVYLFEIKNWNGSFDLVHGGFTGLASCPLMQLKRSQLLLEKWLQVMQFSVPVKAQLIFIGANVGLYGLRRDDPILLAHQIPGFLEDIRKRSGPFLRKSDVHLGQQLAESHVTDNPYRQLAEYCVADVTSGILCKKCRFKMIVCNARMLSCANCGAREFKKVGLHGAIRELDVLFPPQTQRVNQIYNWCNGMVSRSLIHKYLQETKK